MTVLQFRPPPRTPGPTGGPGGGSTSRPRVPVRGSFTTPELATGSMEGWLRVLHCSVQGPILRCLAVVSGTLYDARGQRLGLASTRCQLPVTIGQDEGPPARTDDATGTALVGPLEINLLGFRVHVNQTALPGASVTHGVPTTPAGVTPLHARRRA